MDVQNDSPALGFSEGTIIGFVIGAAVGGVVTYFVTRNVFRKKANEEIEEVRKTYFEMNRKEVAKECKETETQIITASTDEEDPNRLTKEKISKPYVIKFENYIEDDSYDKETLIYYEGNDTLTDQFDHVIDISIIGREALDHFGEEEEDTVYVRNYKLLTDYEVVLEHKSSPPTALAEGDEE